jgi:glyoxylase-like metal-dependent hydrolase (beta-lactamase superfamily II)
MRAVVVLASLILSFAAAFSQVQNVYEVYAIEYARGSSGVPVSNVATGAESKDSVTFSYFDWYLKGDNGKRILVDVGFIQDTAKPMKSTGYYERPDLALQRIKVNANDLTDIIITHPHYDHVGGLDLFSKATVWMQKNDFDYFVRDAWQKDAAHRGPDRQDVLKIVRANLDGRLQLVHGDSIEIIPGIRAFVGSKHTFESQHLLVNSRTDKVLLASDDCWFYYNLDHLLSVPLTFDAKAYVAQLRRMKTLVTDARWIIPGHDLQVLSRFKEVSKGIVRIQ